MIDPLLICPSCGYEGMIETTEEFNININGEEKAIKNTRHLVCPQCGEIEFISGQDIKNF